MLVQSLGIGEVIILETEKGPVKISVSQIYKPRIRPENSAVILRFDADRTIPIVREELLKNGTESRNRSLDSKSGNSNESLQALGPVDNLHGVRAMQNPKPNGPLAGLVAERRAIHRRSTGAG